MNIKILKQIMHKGWDLLISIGMLAIVILLMTPYLVIVFLIAAAFLFLLFSSLGYEGMGDQVGHLLALYFNQPFPTLVYR